MDGVLAEDTRVTGLLCHNAGIDVALTSFHAHNTQRRIPEVLERLTSGQSLALVSDRGMPAVSDPGQELVDAVWAHGGINVAVVPGPSAAIAAFAASGFPVPFSFFGFLPRSGRDRREALEAVGTWPHAAVLYESPHHMQKTLKDLAEVAGDREIFLAREMTKRYEEFWRGPLETLVEQDRTWRGECALVLGPTKKIPGSTRTDWNQLVSRVEQLVSQGLHPNEAIRQVARASGVPRRDLYQEMHSR